MEWDGQGSAAVCWKGTSVVCWECAAGLLKVSYCILKLLAAEDGKTVHLEQPPVDESRSASKGSAKENVMPRPLPAGADASAAEKRLERDFRNIRGAAGNIEWTPPSSPWRKSPRRSVVSPRGKRAVVTDALHQYVEQQGAQQEALIQEMETQMEMHLALFRQAYVDAAQKMPLESLRMSMRELQKVTMAREGLVSDYDDVSKHEQIAHEATPFAAGDVDVKSPMSMEMLRISMRELTEARTSSEFVASDCEASCHEQEIVARVDEKNEAIDERAVSAANPLDLSSEREEGSVALVVCRHLYEIAAPSENPSDLHFGHRKESAALAMSRNLYASINSVEATQSDSRSEESVAMINSRSLHARAASVEGCLENNFKAEGAESRCAKGTVLMALPLEEKSPPDLRLDLDLYREIGA